MINEVGVKLPPDMNKKAEVLCGFIGSFFAKFFENRVKHIKTASREHIVKYAEYLKLAKEYRIAGKQVFTTVPSDDLTPWGKANFRISARDESMPHIILKIGGGYNQSHDADVSDDDEGHAEIRLLVDTQHFVKSFKKSIIDTTETLKHELAHVLQLSDPEGSKINKFWGMPKDKVMSKKADIYGNRDIHGYSTRYSHGMRDIEFKPNLMTYPHYIKNYLNRNHPAYEWVETFKDIIMGRKTHTANEVINNYSEQLGEMLRIDKTRWKQFVKELSVLVFNK